MRYSIFVAGFMRPETFRELGAALELADRLGGYVFDWVAWRRVERLKVVGT